MPLSVSHKYWLMRRIGETRQEFADIIQNNNELLQRLIADVLDLSKIESNSMPLIYKDQDIPTLMKEIYSMILLRMPSGIELRLNDCEALVMEADKNRLTQILTNLLTNSIKHTEKGSSVLDIRERRLLSSFSWRIAEREYREIRSIPYSAVLSNWTVGAKALDWDWLSVGDW